MTFSLAERLGNLEKPGNGCSIDPSQGREEREKSCTYAFSLVFLKRVDSSFWVLFFFFVTLFTDFTLLN